MLQERTNSVREHNGARRESRIQFTCPCMPASLCACLFVRLFVCLFVRLFVCLSVALKDAPLADKALGLLVCKCTSLLVCLVE